MARRRKPAAAAADLVSRIERGEPGAIARALSLVTDESEGYEALLGPLFRRSGRSHKIGFCGAPGSGKSSLINRLVTCFRKAGDTVGILAVDPTSPFTGGAFLGDRLRIQEHSLDEGVFMRSLASRGMVGGLNAAIFPALHVLEAAGFDRILVETVGTGQDEVDIVEVVDTVVCVTAPYQGDEFQAMKAGTTEIADLFVVNKADLQEVDRALGAIRDALSLGPEVRAGWQVRVVPAAAATGQGVAEAAAIIDEHRASLKATGEGERRRRRQLRKELSLLVASLIARNTLERIGERHIDALLAGTTDPLTLGRALLTEEI
ncbi:MAG: hypothetical protein A2X36_09700 [Elusimicrobia bacterium GWA2_69_24]|nr:MAG: hypothetical protein A2X36_09700 [Elusimicrobia bacterium GWA2_69_24]HBL15522.1 methylmalonyl Co-A mutase-associated GTPase MeaB [Elusimicrobiota bacterium]